MATTSSDTADSADAAGSHATESSTAVAGGMTIPTSQLSANLFGAAKQQTAPEGNATIPTSRLSASMFGTATEQGPGPATSSTPDLKRKATDPELKIITIDSPYDLTLIVGTPDSLGGQAAFQVNKGSLRHASDIWEKMLTGAWAEKSQSEIAFPDDVPWAFVQVLHMAHLKMDKLSATMNLAEMSALAVIADKYNLVKLVRMVVDSKGWLAGVCYSV
jgi:hypothetical protein